jgi:hypothetical protein
MLRLYTQKIPDEAKSYWDVPNVLLQKFPAEEFSATTKMTFYPNQKVENERVGLIVMGQRYASLSLKNMKDGVYLIFSVCEDAIKGGVENELVISKVTDKTIYLRVTVSKNAKCAFAYSIDGKKYEEIKGEFQAKLGRWIGAKMGLFATRTSTINDAGYADVDWFRVSK